MQDASPIPFTPSYFSRPTPPDPTFTEADGLLYYSTSGPPIYVEFPPSRPVLNERQAPPPFRTYSLGGLAALPPLPPWYDPDSQFKKGRPRWSGGGSVQAVDEEVSDVGGGMRIVDEGDDEVEDADEDGTTLEETEVQMWEADEEGDDDDDEEGDEEDTIQALNEEERSYLTAEELEMVDEIEAEYAERQGLQDAEEGDVRMSRRRIVMNGESDRSDISGPPKLRKRAPVYSDPPLQGSHPISYLIERAARKWKERVARQSKTLAQAVREYQRRHNRNPPRGFDAWFRYAKRNKVVMIDDGYEQIYTDIEPFFSLPTSVLQSRAHALANDINLPHYINSFTLSVKSGQSSLSGPEKLGSRAEDASDMLSEFVSEMPDMEVTFSGGDLPAVVVSGEARERHLEFAREGILLDDHAANKIDEEGSYRPWQSICPPNSTIRRVARGDIRSRAPRRPSFVAEDHITAMDMCVHPENQFKSGYTAWDGPRPYLLYPLFSWSKTSMHSDILTIPLDFYYEDVGVDPPWESKISQVFWRGSTIGIYHDRQSEWRRSHRDRLVRLTNEREGDVSVAFDAGDSLKTFTAPIYSVNSCYFDVRFSGAPVSCSQRDGTCDSLRREYDFDAIGSRTESNSYKYVLDIDGNGPSRDFHRLLSSTSLVFKSTIFSEWFSSRIVPWYHYIPVKLDYSDLHDIAVFFVGLPDGTGSHDELAKSIAENGKMFASEHWREADMAAYQYLLYLEFARVMAREGDSHDFTA